jgi:hypothetical protein
MINLKIQRFWSFERLIKSMTKIHFRGMGNGSIDGLYSSGFWFKIF